MRFYSCVLVFLQLALSIQAQETISLVSWNLLNFYPSSSDRIPHYQTVIDSIRPDILVVQEIRDEVAAVFFHAEVLQESLSMAPFIEGYDSDNALYFDSQKFSSVGTSSIATGLRDITKFSLRHHISGDTLHVFSVHLKSSTGVTNVAQRKREVDSLRKATDALSPNSFFIVCGDFNIYGSIEPAYVRLLEQDGIGGHLVDPIVMDGTWNNPAYAKHHTQSPRTRSFGGGAAGGMDDRFDLILFSEALMNAPEASYVEGSTWAIGNDGLHFNDSINRPPNLAVSTTIANALHYASDHLPIKASLTFNNTLGTQSPVSFSNLWKVITNPATDYLNIESPKNLGTPFLSLYDMSGKLVSSAQGFQIDVRTVPNGVYLLMMIGNRQSSGLIVTVSH